MMSGHSTKRNWATTPRGNNSFIFSDLTCWKVVQSLVRRSGVFKWTPWLLRWTDLLWLHISFGVFGPFCKQKFQLLNLDTWIMPFLALMHIFNKNFWIANDYPSKRLIFQLLIIFLLQQICTPEDVRLPVQPQLLTPYTNWKYACYTNIRILYLTHKPEFLYSNVTTWYMLYIVLTSAFTPSLSFSHHHFNSALTSV